MSHSNFWTRILQLSIQYLTKLRRNRSNNTYTIYWLNNGGATCQYSTSYYVYLPIPTSSEQECADVQISIEHSRVDLQERSPLEAITLCLLFKWYLDNMYNGYLLDRLRILSPFQQHCKMLPWCLTNSYPYLNIVNTRDHRIKQYSLELCRLVKL